MDVRIGCSNKFLSVGLWARLTAKTRLSAPWLITPNLVALVETVRAGDHAHWRRLAFRSSRSSELTRFDLLPTHHFIFSKAMTVLVEKLEVLYSLYFTPR